MTGAVASGWQRNWHRLRRVVLVALGDAVGVDARVAVAVERERQQVERARGGGGGALAVAVELRAVAGAVELSGAGITIPRHGAVAVRADPRHRQRAIVVVNQVEPAGIVLEWGRAYRRNLVSGYRDDADLRALSTVGEEHPAHA